MDADPFQLPKFIAWLETKPRHKKYETDNNQKCIIAQYLIANGWATPLQLGWVTAWDHVNNQCVDIPHDVQDAAHKEPHTYGAALKRAKVLA